MKKSSGTKTKASALEKGNRGGLLWELRPCGMLVQKRSGECEVGTTAKPIKVLVSHGSYQYEINVPSQATFGELKRVLSHEAGLKLKGQRILFQGKERENEEYLHMAGVKHNSKVVLMETSVSASTEKNVLESKTNQGIKKACEAIAQIRTDVDKLVQKVSLLESGMRGDKRISEKEIVVLTELLMTQLLKLDGIEAEGEAKAQRRIEVRRIQSNVETLDMLKAINTNPFVSNKTDWTRNRVSVTAQSESFDTGFGTPKTARSRSHSSDFCNKWNIHE